MEKINKKVKLEDINFFHLLWDELDTEKKAMVCSYFKIPVLSKSNENYLAILYYGVIFEPN